MKILAATTPFPEGDHPLDPPCNCPVHVHAEIACDVFAHPEQRVPFVLLMGDRVPQRAMLAQRWGQA